MPTYGQKIIWNVFSGTVSVEAGGCASREEAFSKAFEDAKASGWTRPRWWQWWRWGDKNYEAILRKHVETMSALTQKLPPQSGIANRLSDLSWQACGVKEEEKMIDIPKFSAERWFRYRGLGWVAQVPCDKERDRDSPGLKETVVSIDDELFDCIGVERTLPGTPIAKGEMIGLLVREHPSAPASPSAPPPPRQSQD